jgi:hypothetical protein
VSVMNHTLGEHTSPKTVPPGKAVPGKTIPWAFLCLWLGGVLVYLILSLAPTPFRFPHRVVIGPLTLDKVVHFAVFALFALAALRFFRTKRGIAAAMAVLIITSVGSEFIQLLNPTRAFSHGDLIANLLGCLVGLLAGVFLLTHWTGRGPREPLQADDA